jgi:hypothetical protein
MARGANSQQYVNIEGEVIEESLRAYRFIDVSGFVTCWLPKSISTWDPEFGIITIPLWLANQHELKGTPAFAGEVKW